MKPKNLKSAVAVVLALAGALALGACNTMEGIGQDVSAGGSALEDTARDAKE